MKNLPIEQRPKPPRPAPEGIEARPRPDGAAVAHYTLPPRQFCGRPRIVELYMDAADFACIDGKGGARG